MKDSKIHKTCSINKCEAKVLAKGYCQTHYHRFNKYGDPQYNNPNYVRRGKVCTFEDCQRPQYAKLLCTMHYNRNLIHGDPSVCLHRDVCTIAGCNKKHVGRGYCGMHLARVNNYGNPHFLKEVGDKGRMKHRLYTRYRGMMDRCYYKKSHKYPRYGLRGITVCERWLDRIEGFENYVADIEALPNAYKETWTIDRIDNDGNYEPTNVRWASPITQANNREMSKK